MPVLFCTDIESTTYFPKKLFKQTTLLLNVNTFGAVFYFINLLINILIFYRILVPEKN